MKVKIIEAVKTVLFEDKILITKKPTKQRLEKIKKYNHFVYSSN